MDFDEITDRKPVDTIVCFGNNADRPMIVFGYRTHAGNGIQKTQRYQQPVVVLPHSFYLMRFDSFYDYWMFGRTIALIGETQYVFDWLKNGF